MTRKELLKYCRYYKGETECPFAGDSDAGRFWLFESMFVENAVRDVSLIESYKKRVEKYNRKYHKEENLLTSKNVSIYTKCLALHVQDMMEKWLPYDVDSVLNY